MTKRNSVANRIEMLWTTPGYFSSVILSTGCTQAISLAEMILFEGKTLNFMIK